MVKFSTEKVDFRASTYDSRWSSVYERIARLTRRNDAVVVETDSGTTVDDLKKLRLYVLAKARKNEFGFRVRTRLRLKKLYVWRDK